MAMLTLTKTGTTAIFTTEAITNRTGRNESVFPITFLASALTAETIDLEMSPDDGSTWVKVYDDAGSQVQLSATRLQVTCYGAGTYRLNKTAGTETPTVYVSLPGRF